MPEIPEADDARLTALVEALADGTPVDWTAAEEAAPTDHDRIVIRRLSRIGLAAALQRTASGAGDVESSGPQGKGRRRRVQ